MTPLFPMRYEGDGNFTAIGRAKLCDKQFVVGQTYVMAEQEHRSKKSHDHFFAIVHDVWASLPEKLSGEFPSPDHLRKFALCKTGFCKIRKIVCANASEAIFASATMLELDTYAVVAPVGNIVTIATAESQSLRAMGKARFQKSKEAVLQYLSELVGADVAAMMEAA